MRSRVTRRRSRRLTRTWGLVFAASFLVFAASLWSAAPALGQKLESLRYRILESMPLPEHTEFLPTPRPTFTRIALAPTSTHTAVPSATATTVPTDNPTASPSASPSPTRTARPTVSQIALKPIAPAVTLTGFKNDYQRWNNCGPTTLEMALSFFGHNHPQADIAAFLKPDPDDKNVSPDEMAAYVTQDGLNATIRVNGSLDLIRQFLSNGLPLVVETGFDPPRAHQGWMGHYRMITGYDDKVFITQDSYDGPNIKVSFDELDSRWKDFGRLYLAIYTSDQLPLVRALIGSNWDDQQMYAGALGVARQELESNPEDGFAAFNIGSALLGLGQYADAAAAFDQARQLKLPWRMMWYQFGPYMAYLKTARYDEVIALTNATLKVTNDLEESHYYKGLALNAEGKTAEARTEFLAALHYNQNYALAQQALAELGQP